MEKVTREALAGYIDHTLLGATATEGEIKELCAQACLYHFKAVCINPCYVPLAVNLLRESGVVACTVVGFPLGATSTGAKVAEAVEAVRAGAGEVDMVLNIGALKSAAVEAVKVDMQQVVRAVKDVSVCALVKVIIEAGALSDEEKVLACTLALKAGADFVKTSTGFGYGGATAEDVSLMRRVVGNSMGVKASGGIRSLGQALDLLKAGASRLGTSAGVKIMEECIYE